jgi:hypothetical protein
MIWLFVYLGVSLATYVTTLYFTYHSSSGLDCDDLCEGALIAFFWPVWVTVCPFWLLKSYENHNGGYLLKKPTKQEKFDKQIDNVLK